VWSEALSKLVVDRNIPVPAQASDLKSLSAKELEARARHATAFHRNWTSQNPRPRNIFEFAVGSEEEQCGPVQHVRFLPGQNGRLVLSVQQSRVVCWEIPLTGNDAYIVAERSISGGYIEDVAVNEDENNRATLVLAWTRHATNPFSRYVNHS
jgi:hypothetical protein